MKRLLLLLFLVFAFCLTGCGNSGSSTPQAVASAQNTAAPAEAEKPSGSEQAEEQGQAVAPEHSESEKATQTEQETTEMIQFTIGDHTILAQLADNASAGELKALLKKGPIAMSASNYGGFEKVCSLGTRLTSQDVQTTTQAGDIMLYNGSQIVIFYGSNSWAYTRLATVVEGDVPDLKAILSGSEKQVIIELASGQASGH